MIKRAVVKGLGSYLPSRVVSNDELSRTLDTDDAWITSRSGIRQRHIAADEEVTSDLAVACAHRILADAGCTPDDVELILIATTTPDRTLPSTAAYVQAKLGMSHGAALDIQAACSGFVYGLSLVKGMIESGQINTALVIGAETLSRIIDWTDRSTAVLFGDGAGGVLLAAEEGDGARGVLGCHLRCDGNLADFLDSSGGPSFNREIGHINMNGREVFRHAVANIADAIIELLEQTNHKSADIDWFVPHQANLRIIQGVAKRINLPVEKTVITVDKHANTSAASIPLALDDLVKSGRAKSGDLLMLEAMGAGLTWGSSLVRL